MSDGGSSVGTTEAALYSTSSQTSCQVASVAACVGSSLSPPARERTQVCTQGPSPDPSAWYQAAGSAALGCWVPPLRCHLTAGDLAPLTQPRPRICCATPVPRLRSLRDGRHRGRGGWSLAGAPAQAPRPPLGLDAARALAAAHRRLLRGRDGGAGEAVWQPGRALLGRLLSLAGRPVYSGARGDGCGVTRRRRAAGRAPRRTGRLAGRRRERLPHSRPDGPGATSRLRRRPPRPVGRPDAPRVAVAGSEAAGCGSDRLAAGASHKRPAQA